MPASMNTLPAELIDMISRLLELSDLKNLRLVSKNFSLPATQQLFSHLNVTFTPDYLSCQTLRNIHLSSHLSKNVVRVTVDTQDLFDPRDEDNAFESREAIKAWEQFRADVGSIGSFLNVHQVQLVFEEHNAISPICGIRSDVLDAFFDSLVRMDKLRCLSILNLQSTDGEHLRTLAKVRTTLGQISELRLEFSSGTDDSTASFEYHCSRVHDFFGRLPDVWLRPAANSLTRLHLKCDYAYWGYTPRVDFRGLHFPRLNTLELEHYTFSHDWQLDWILSHGATLEELVLCNAVIISDFNKVAALDSERYLANPTREMRGGNTWSYSRRWAHYLSQFEQHLANLRIFSFADSSGDLPDDWYMMFDGMMFDGKRIDPWTGIRSLYDERADCVGFCAACEFDPDHEHFEWVMDALVEDCKALDKLMAVVSSRA